jgi:hypothetical protein
MWVCRVDPERNLLFVKGGVPGTKGSFLRITDALTHKNPWAKAAAETPPFPTWIEEEATWEAATTDTGMLAAPVPANNPTIPETSR